MNLHDYFAKYTESHRHPLNVTLHHICIPLIGWSTLAFFHTIPLSSSLSVSHPLALLTLILYLYFKNVRVLLLVACSQILCFLSFRYFSDLRIISLLGFILGWVGQLYGHRLERNRPSFTKEIVFILIGPLWIVRKYL